MKKNNLLKVSMASVLAASVFFTTVGGVGAASNIDQLAVKAEKASTVLKWSISVEGSADFKNRPYDEYNKAKKAVADLEVAVSKLSGNEKIALEKKLADAKTQIKRAQAYIDAITSSEKIISLTKALDVAIASGDINKVESAYNSATAEYRKQSKLLDRVYGQTTRDGVRNEVKPKIENLIQEVKYDVTVKTHLDKAKELIANGETEKAALEIEKANSTLSLNESKIKFKSVLQKEITEVNLSKDAPIVEPIKPEVPVVVPEPTTPSKPSIDQGKIDRVHSLINDIPLVTYYEDMIIIIETIDGEIAKLNSEEKKKLDLSVYNDIVNFHKKEKSEKEKLNPGNE